ncbi:MAG: glycogen debranching protein GlgX [Thermodesulfobacteriota bacterium]
MTRNHEGWPVTPFEIQTGTRYPLGASWRAQGTNFSIFSRHATSVELLLYEHADSPNPLQVIKLDPSLNRTFFFWHVYVVGLPTGIHYTWKVDGPGDTRSSGFRFDKRRELLDPWARAITTTLWNRRTASLADLGAWPAMRAMVIDDRYDWEGDQPIDHVNENMIIYEMHVGGFTKHTSARVTHPGTFAGVIEKIPYLKALGVTDVELLPVMAFDEQDVPDGAADEGLRNFWGYSTHSFFCPHPGYCISPERGTHLNEFRDMVKALHRAGIGVILDVVFNHTAEAEASGPVINFKGFANETFYHLDPLDRNVYRDYTGCGNTVNCNHPIVTAFILECLEFWVREMHVDGFRFDLASVLARGEDGNALYHAPVLWSIEFSAALDRAKVIAEAWDAAGLYQVGGFPGFRWAEWNGRYRDVIRRFIRGDRGLISELATRVSGSSDLYEDDGRLPGNSINFVTCHDGFTLYDLVAYNQKHNEANAQDSRDGTNDNLSWNCGVEGDTEDPQILELRKRQAKNFIAILLLSQGVPLLLAGDEVLRTQRGNNNAYCQDNELGWFDWNQMETNRDMFLFVSGMIAFRKRHPCLMHKRFLTGKKAEKTGMADVTWHGARLHHPLWEDRDAQVLGFTLAAVAPGEEDIHVIMNMSANAIEIELPVLQRQMWFRAVDTAQPSPTDIIEPKNQVPIDEDKYFVSQRSVVVFESRP